MSKITVLSHHNSLRANTPGRVSLHLGSRVTLTGSDNTLAGLKFHGGGSSTPVSILGDRNTVRDCVVEHHQAPHWVLIDGRENTVTNCRFSNKTAKERRPGYLDLYTHLNSFT